MKESLDKNVLAFKWNAVPEGRLDFAELKLSLSEICQSSYRFALQIAIELTSQTVGKIKHYSTHYKIGLGACPGQVDNLTFGTVGSFHFLFLKPRIKHWSQQNNLERGLQIAQPVSVVEQCSQAWKGNKPLLFLMLPLPPRFLLWHIQSQDKGKGLLLSSSTSPFYGLRTRAEGPMTYSWTRTRSLCQQWYLTQLFVLGQCFINKTHFSLHRFFSKQIHIFRLSLLFRYGTSSPLGFPWHLPNQHGHHLLAASSLWEHCYCHDAPLRSKVPTKMEAWLF